MSISHYLFVEEAKDDCHHSSLQCFGDDENIMDHKEISGARLKRIKWHNVKGVLNAKYWH